MSRVRKSLVSTPRSLDPEGPGRELVIVTGMSGAGKLSALKSLEDLGYYSVDNLPMELLPRFAELVLKSADIARASLGVDVREGNRLDRFPGILRKVRKVLPTRVLFLEASEEAIVRRFSETRRPHPLGRGETVIASIRAERKRLDPVRNVAGHSAGHDQIHGARSACPHQLAIRARRRQGRPEHDDLGHELRVQERRSFGCRSGVRCALPPPTRTSCRNFAS